MATTNDPLVQYDIAGGVATIVLARPEKRNALNDRMLEHYPNPTLAVLQGTSLAGGWELALHCDIRIAGPDAKFGMPLARLGLVAPYAAITRLVQIGGLATATDLLLSASMIDAPRAHQLGFVTHLAASDDLVSTAQNYARGIAALAPLAVKEMKRVLRAIALGGGAADSADFDDCRRRDQRQCRYGRGIAGFPGEPSSRLSRALA